MIRRPPSRDEILEARMEVNNAHAEVDHWRLRLQQAESREERAMATLSLLLKGGGKPPASSPPASSPLGQVDAVSLYVEAGR